MIRDEIRRLFDEGKSYGVIAAELGITRNVVAGYCKRNGWSRDGQTAPIVSQVRGRPRQPSLPYDQRKAWGYATKARIYAAGYTQMDLSRFMAINNEYLNSVLNARATLSLAQGARIDAAIDAMIKNGRGHA